jgi:glycosyltransferase involved in cell wall biosynthesis
MAPRDDELTMRVAVVHNRYQQPGGEDQVFEREASLLESAGHEVLRYELHNDAVASMPAYSVAARSMWNPTTLRSLQALFARFRPDVVHVHNTLPLISPAAFAAARRAGAVVIQTLHNYRMVCPSASLFRDGHPCELCVGRAVQIAGVRYACYRGSRAATAVIAGGTLLHRALGTYTRNVDRFIALTEFARAKLIKGGVPAWQLVVKPNFTEPAAPTRSHVGTAALFVGRLSEEKGVRTLVEAWQRYPDLPPLRIVGDGPLRPTVEALAISNGAVAVLGALTREEVQAEMRSAALLVFPSVGYETFGLSIIEAFSVGVPVVASSIGSAAEIVEDAEVGLTFTPGNPAELAASVRRLVADPQFNLALGARALKRYESLYTPAANLKRLERIYRDAMRSRPAPAER